MAVTSRYTNNICCANRRGIYKYSARWIVYIISVQPNLYYHDKVFKFGLSLNIIRSYPIKYVALIWKIIGEINATFPIIENECSNGAFAATFIGSFMITVFVTC
jgi:hypothetical protein